MKRERKVVEPEPHFLETIQEAPSGTDLKAWFFRFEKKFYQATLYTPWRCSPCISIWPANRTGKRTARAPIFTTATTDTVKAITEFVESRTVDAQ